MKRYDAVVVGSGPNGLGAAITLARAGRSVCLLEAAPTLGGGMRSAELTLPSFVHDECSGVHPLAASSPLFRSLPLSKHGLEWVQPTFPLAHPFGDGTAAVLHRDIVTMESQFPDDAESYRRLVAPLVANWRQLTWEFLQPVTHIPRHPLLLARFGLPSLRSAAGLARSHFHDGRLRALFAGSAGHAILPLDQPLTASFGLVLTAAAHAVGWPIVKGGSQQLAVALASYLSSLGGTIETGRPITKLDDLPPHRVVLFDVAPERLLDICGDALGDRYRRRLLGFRRGGGVLKMDFALSAPIPWESVECRSAGTVHLGGSLEEMVHAERSVSAGKLPGSPFVLVSQPSVFDTSRAPNGHHTAWAYCHLPRSGPQDWSEALEQRIERFAPGFRQRILARSVVGPAEMERSNPNLVHGDITGGSNGGRQLFFRPTVSLRPYRTPAPGVYICSASTPPGGGVHGMAGYWAARDALRQLA